MKKLSILVSALLMAACSSNKSPKSYIIAQDEIKLNSDQKILLLLERPIRDDKEISDKFRIVKPSHTAKLTGLKILSFLGGANTTSFTKYDLVGDIIGNENFHKDYTFFTLKERVQQNVKLDKEAKLKAITVYPVEFSLIYDELVGNNKYTLHYKFNISATYKNTNSDSDGYVITGDSNFQCDEKDESKDLSEWEKENYQLAYNSAKNMSDKCLNKIIPLLFKVN